MAGRTPFVTMDSETAADLRSRGFDPYVMDRAAHRMLTYIYTSLIPDLPVSQTGPLTALPASDGVDRISLLPDVLLRDIICRLPVTDAARTTVLASGWRRLWLSAEPVLVDAYLRPDDYRWPPTPADSPAITATVSRILEAHPGPFRCVRLTCSHMSAHQAQLARWLQLLAAKGVHDLVLVNRPWPVDVPLPATLFAISTLTRLYVGIWKFPDMARLPRGTSFPHLRELGLCGVYMEQGDVDSLVGRSPVLEILSIQGIMEGLRLRLVGQSLRCVQICSSNVESITVLKAPQLERLILQVPGKRIRGLIRILDAPKLCVFGFPENHVLEIRDTIIMSGMKASLSTIVTSVKILSLKVCFGVRNEAEMVPVFLKCFPNVERPHITSGKQSTGQLKFREGPIESAMSRIKMMCFREFRGDEGQVAFLKLFFKSATMLETAVVIMANPSFTPFSTAAASSIVRRASEVNRCNQVLVLESTGPEGGDAWSFRIGSDFSCEDPFSAMEALNQS